MSGDVFHGGPHVEQYDFASPSSTEELLPGEELEILGGGEESSSHLLDLGEPGFGKVAQSETERGHVVGREAIRDVETFLLGFDETRRAEHLEVLGRVRGGHARLAGKRFDGSRSLTEQVEQLESTWRGKSLADSGDLFVERVFRAEGYHSSK